MCGICGVIGDLGSDHEKAFKNMLIFDSVRGEDSTGVLGVKKYEENEYILSKQVGNPFEVLEMERTKKIFNSASRILLGHNRYATQGKVNKYNAHPYDLETLVGVHNGSLTNKHALHNGNLYDVDSQALYAHIEAKGVEDALRTARGAFALVWWNKEENTMNFVRNKERPLWFGVAENHKAMFFASEAWMFEVSAARNKIKLSHVEEFEEAMLYQIPVGKGGVLGKPVVRAVELAKPYVYTPPNNVSHIRNLNGAREGAKEGDTSNTDKAQTSPGSSNETTTTPTKTSVMDAVFLGQKNVLFEAICVNRDKYGAEYVVAFCPSRPHFDVRVYRHTGSKKLFNDISCEFEADVSSFVNTEGKYGYYKLSPWNIKILDDPDSSIDPVAGLDPAELVPDHRGRDIPQAQWVQQYGTCGICTENIAPQDLEEGARFTANGECLCPSCAGDKELIKYVTLV